MLEVLRLPGMQRHQAVVCDGEAEGLTTPLKLDISLRTEFRNPEGLFFDGQCLPKMPARDEQPDEAEGPAGFRSIGTVVLDGETGARLVAGVIGVSLVQRRLDAGEGEHTPVAWRDRLPVPVGEGDCQVQFRKQLFAVLARAGQGLDDIGKARSFPEAACHQAFDREGLDSRAAERADPRAATIGVAFEPPDETIRHRGVA